MRSTRDLMNGINIDYKDALQDEIDRQFDTSRRVLAKFATFNPKQVIEGYMLVLNYANVMFRSVWTEVNGAREFTNPVKFCVDRSDLDMVLRLRGIAIDAKKLNEFDELVAEHASEEFYEKFCHAATKHPHVKHVHTNHAHPLQPVVGSFPIFFPVVHKKRAPKVNVVNIHLLGDHHHAANAKSRH